MKAAKIATLCLIILALSIFANSLYIEKTTKRLSQMVKQADISDMEKCNEEYERIFKEFKKAERFISLTVSHDDLTNIEEGFADIIGASRAGISANVMIVKSRLEDSLEHLGRLSGINLDSII